MAHFAACRANAQSLRQCADHAPGRLSCIEAHPGSLLAQRGVPMAVIAQQLGHASVKVTEKHYAHLAPSYVADEIRRGAPSFGFKLSRKVVPLG